MKIRIPEDTLINLNQLELPPTVHYNILLVLIHQILIFETYYTDKNKLYADISKYIFEDFVGRTHSRPHLDYLLEEGIIQTDGIFKPGIKSKGYRVASTSISIIQFDLHDSKLEHKQKKAFIHLTKKAKVSRRELQKCKKIIESYSIDDAALSFIDYCYENKIEYANDKKYTHHSARLAKIKVLMIQAHEIHFKRNNFNHRLDTNITFLNNELMIFLIPNHAENIASLDCANSQPYLLSCILLLLKQLKSNQKDEFINKLINRFGKNNYKHVISIPLSATISELNHFHKICKKGLIYDELASALNRIYNTTKYNRDKAKKGFMYILFNNNNDEYQQVFEKIFPAISKWLYDVKHSVFPDSVREGNSMFSGFITNIESLVWIDSILIECSSRKIDGITKHDSIIVKKSDVDAVKEIIASAYNNIFGNVPTIKEKEIDVTQKHISGRIQTFDEIINNMIAENAYDNLGIVDPTLGFYNDDILSDEQKLVTERSFEILNLPVRVHNYISPIITDNDIIADFSDIPELFKMG